MSRKDVQVYVMLGAATVFVVGCAGEQPGPAEFEVHAPLFAVGGNADVNLGTHLG